MAKLARISVSRSGTSATVTLENFDSDEWNIYRAPKGEGDSGEYTMIKEGHETASYSDSGLTSGANYAWKGAIVGNLGSTEVINTSTEVINTSIEVIGGFEENQIGEPKYSTL